MAGSSWDVVSEAFADTDAASRLRALFDDAPVAHAIVGLDGRIVVANQALSDLLGYAAADLVDRMMIELVAPANRGAALAETEALLDGHYTRAPGSLGHCIHRDGHLVPTCAYTALIRNSDGDPRAFVSTLVNLAEEKRAWSASQDARAAETSAIQRIRLISRTADIANAASSLDEAIPRILDAVCAELGWRSGALLTWTASGLKTSTSNDHVPWTDAPQLTDPIDGPRTLIHGGRRIVAAPLTTDEPFALAFDTSTADSRPADGHPDPVSFELLTLITNQCARVRERENTRRLLQANEARFRVVFDDSPFPMGIADETFRYVAVNDAACELLGRDREDLVGRPVAEVIHADDLPRAGPASEQAWRNPSNTHTFEIRLRHASGDPIPVLNTITWMTGPDGTHMLLGQMQDLSARRNAEHELRRQAETDALTGLTSRTGLIRILSETDPAEITAILTLGLDSFSLTNQIHGHDVGDEILAAVAERIQSAIDPHDTAARSGGDQFVVVCRCGNGDNGHHIVTTLANTIQTALSAPLQTSVETLSVTASIGIAERGTTPRGTTARGTVYGSAFDLFQRADTAMAQAKSLGKDRQVAYDAHLHEKTRHHQETVLLLRGALDEGRFVVHYQPVVATDTGTIIGFEALTRLTDRDGKLVFPDAFIPEAESSGLIVPMGTWVLHEACRRAAELRDSTGRDLHVSVNVAARQAIRADLTDAVNTALAQSGLPPESLTLELTESTLLEADEGTLRQFHAFRDRGIHIALDDFGTGYSSLTYLRRLPVTSVKVDKSFVLGMTTDTDDAAIVRAVIGLARDVGLEWVAEGVETRDHWKALQQFGPGLAQGYLFAKPTPSEQLDRLLADGVLPD